MKRYYHVTSIAPIIVRTIFNKKEFAKEFAAASNQGVLTYSPAAFTQDALPIEGAADPMTLADCASAVGKHSFGENSVDYCKLAKHRVVISAKQATKEYVTRARKHGWLGQITLDDEFRNCGDDDPDSSTQFWLIMFRETIDEDQLRELPKTDVDAIRILDGLYRDACRKYDRKGD
jgi:hypothetical protein